MIGFCMGESPLTFFSMIPHTSVSSKVTTLINHLVVATDQSRRPPDGDDSFLKARRPPPGGFGSIYSILETKAFFRDEQSNGKPSKARIRYYMSYGPSVLAIISNSIFLFMIFNKFQLR
mmetsp:Transcript_14447/g.25418  ORF Transcript_14447/g.25418 Transcript_14447/m.25418 type:complete len:119 (+) Transcript_14447:467-823(+)